MNAPTFQPRQPVDLPAESVAGEEDPGAWVDLPAAGHAPTGSDGAAEQPCPRCGGTGQAGANPCPECDGTGKVIAGAAGR
jgi:hypothetical protein